MSTDDPQRDPNLDDADLDANAFDGASAELGPDPDNDDISLSGDMEGGEPAAGAATDEPVEAEVKSDPEDTPIDEKEADKVEEEEPEVEVKKTPLSVYSLMLAAAFLFICISCIMLYVELRRYGQFKYWDTNEGRPKSVSWVQPPAIDRLA